MFRFRGDPKKLTAAEINRWNVLANRQARGELQPRKAPTLRGYDPNARLALCKNTSGSDRARFDCMAIDAITWELDILGNSDVLFNLITADPAKSPAVLWEPIANGGVGLAIIDGPAIAKVGSGTDLLGVPETATHRIAPSSSGTIKILSAPHATDVRLLPVILNVGGAGGGGGIDDIRWVDPILEYHDSSGWHTIDTAVTCGGVSPFVGGIGI